MEDDVIIQTVVMLKASPYSISDDKDPKRKIEGVSCFYYPYKGFKDPVNNYVERDDFDSFGSDATKVSFAIDFFKLIEKRGVPAVYKFTKEMGVDSQTRKEKVTVTNVEFAGYLNPTITPEPPKAPPTQPPK